MKLLNFQVTTFKPDRKKYDLINLKVLALLAVTEKTRKSSGLLHALGEGKTEIFSYDLKN